MPVSGAVGGMSLARSVILVTLPVLIASFSRRRSAALPQPSAAPAAS